METDRAVNLGEFIEQNLDKLAPPVSNYMLYGGNHLKVMIVGGPNERDDFHVEAGEEFFYQMTGRMDLDVMQEGIRSRLPIEPGHVFVLPSYVPHSPQRYSNTIGLVIERTRLLDELDELRWYWPDTNSVLYQERFHCTDLGSQIKATIERFMSSDQSKFLLEKSCAQRPDLPEPLAREPPISNPRPVSIEKLISSSPDTAIERSPTSIIKSEFSVNLYKGEVRVSLNQTPRHEIFLLQISGSSTISAPEPQRLHEPIKLYANHVCLLSGSNVEREVVLETEESVLITVFSNYVIEA